MVNTYGKTKCPECQAENAMYRPLEGPQSIRTCPAWDGVQCHNCGAVYLHSAVIHGHAHVIKILEKHGCSLKAITKAGESAFNHDTVWFDNPMKSTLTLALADFNEENLLIKLRGKQGPRGNWYLDSDFAGQENGNNDQSCGI